MKTEKPDPKAVAVTDIILESISEGVFTVDENWRITSFNRAAEKITGVPREAAIGRHCWDVFRSNMCERDCALRKTMKLKKNLMDTSTYIVDSDQRRIPVVVCTSLLKDETGRILGGVETFRDMSLVEELKKELDARYQVGDMVSASPAMQKIFSILPQIAQSSSTVLIQGETGTGKELLARAIHDLSPRRKGPFVPVNCAALPDTLLESELFGYKAGAFTDAKRDKTGLFAAAKGGTLFLDEIGEVSPAFQVRLLRVLQDQVFHPLGATQDEKADVRIIAATNRNLQDLVNGGSFRQDLFYRINVVCLDLPPLRKRREDIPLLVDQFVHKNNLLRGKRITGLTEEALALIMSYDFPGNIRELENAVEHAFVLCREGRIALHCLPDTIIGPIRPSAMAPVTVATSIKAAEAIAIREALERNRHNRLAAARDLGMHKSTLFRKIKTLGIDLPKTDGRSRPKTDQ
ncbi:MAG: sigma 54-interacting transcriptional regulator [Deltaproteobacteria bacterium]|nr:sigma 54-interacting transcriptional regulator [Deltaproteobacteria bacterium]